VGRHEHRGAELVDLDQQLDQLPARHRVEVAGRLVGDEDGGIVDQGPRNGGALLLATRKLGRQMVCVVLQPDQAEQLRNPLPHDRSRNSCDVEREGDVLPHRLVRQQPEILEDDADSPPKPRHLPPAHAKQVVARDRHVSGRRHLLADEEPNERALAGARRADQEDEVAARDLDVDVCQCHLAVGVGHPDVHHADDRGVGICVARSPAQERCHRAAPMVTNVGAPVARGTMSTRRPAAAPHHPGLPASGGSPR
jgi:hypothetical protein